MDCGGDCWGCVGEIEAEMGEVPSLEEIRDEFENTKPFLLGQLRHAMSEGAEELRFVSGQQPSIKVAGSLRPAEGIEVRAELVQALHEVCLSEACPADPHQAFSTSYVVSFQGLGAFRCEFKTKGNTRSLSLYPESEGCSATEAVAKSNPSSSGGEAAADQED